ncbi:multicopper oxidase family protein [Frankia sp. Cpl3]|nr:multicopper oxidase family protein [Frankia sp. Cpl3]
MVGPLSRRDFLTAGVATTVLGVGAVAGATQLGAGPDGAAQATAVPGGHLGHGVAAPVAASVAPPVTPFSVPLPVPPVLAPTQTTADSDIYDITARVGQEELLPGFPAEVHGYNGSYVGPTIKARVGRRVVVRHRNELPHVTAVHVHGAHVSAANDGFPTDVINTGTTRTYEYPNNQAAATLWYHDHAHHHESENIYRGLHGFYLLENPPEAALGLPSGDFDIPLLLSDGHFDESGQLVYAVQDEAGRTTVLTNGRPAPYFRVQARKYRFRLLNASNMRIFNLILGQNEEFTQVAGDGGLLPAPARIRSVLLSAAERADIVIDFSRYQPGAQVVLTNTRNLLDPSVPISQPVLRFDVVAREGTDTSRVPAALATLPALPPATRVRDIVLSYHTVAFPFAINGNLFDPNRVDFQIKRGTTEIWRITNPVTPVATYHNLHLHLVQFRVLDRNGIPPGPTERGLKDTVLLAPGDTVRVQATFTEFLGKFVYHCHVVDHASTGMMAVFETIA